MRARPPTAPEPAYFSRQVSDARRFYLLLAPNRRRSLTVISGGWELCRPDYRIRRPGFPHPTLEFVARGAGELTLAARRVTLVPGIVYVYGRGVPHTIRCDPRSPMLKYFAVFAGSEARAMLRNCRMTPGTVLRVVDPERIREIFDDLIDRALGDRIHRQWFCGAALLYLITRIAAARSTAGSADRPALITYERCRRHIEQAAGTARRLTDIAAACYVSSAYMCRLFRRFGRQSPMGYLRHLRMNRAVELLLGGRMPVKAVAAELGYSDPHNFSRAFRRVFGVPPGRLLHA